MFFSNSKIISVSILAIVVDLFSPKPSLLKTDQPASSILFLIAIAAEYVLNMQVGFEYESNCVNHSLVQRIGFLRGEKASW